MTGLSLFSYSFTRYSSLRAFSLNEKTGSVQDHISTRFFVFFSRISLHIFIRVFFFNSQHKSQENCFLVGKCRRLVSFCSLSLFLTSHSPSQYTCTLLNERPGRLWRPFLYLCVSRLFSFQIEKISDREKKKRLRSSGLVYIISNRPRTCESSASTRPRTDGD